MAILCYPGLGGLCRNFQERFFAGISRTRCHLSSLLCQDHRGDVVCAVRTLNPARGVTPCLLLCAVLPATWSPASPITLTPSLAGMGSSSPRPLLHRVLLHTARVHLYHLSPGGGDGDATSSQVRHLSGLLPRRQSKYSDKYGLSLHSPHDVAGTARTAFKPHYQH